MEEYGATNFGASIIGGCHIYCMGGRQWISDLRQMSRLQKHKKLKENVHPVWTSVHGDWSGNNQLYDVACKGKQTSHNMKFCKNPSYDVPSPNNKLIHPVCVTIILLFNLVSQTRSSRWHSLRGAYLIQGLASIVALLSGTKRAAVITQWVVSMVQGLVNVQVLDHISKY